MFGPVLVGKYEHFVEEDDSEDGLRLSKVVNDSFIDQSSIDISFSLDDHDIDSWVLCTESKSKVEVIDRFILECDVLVEASFEHH